MAMLPRNRVCTWRSHNINSARALLTHSGLGRRHISTDNEGGNQPPLSWEQWRQQAKEMVDYIADYYGTLDKQQRSTQESKDTTLPVKSQVEPGYLQSRLPRKVPDEPESFRTVLQDVDRHIMPGVTHWQHPSFFAYFPANSSGPAMLGDMLSSMFNVVGFSWVSSPACTELETIMLDWLAEFLQLPPQFLSNSGTGGGVIQGTASEATAVALLAAKRKALKTFPELDQLGSGSVGTKLRLYASDQAHSSVLKAAKIAGIPDENCISLQTMKSTEANRSSSFEYNKTLEEVGNYVLDPQILRQAIQRDREAGYIPCFACATLGTTSSGAFDPLLETGQVCREFDVWLHVDAAWAGSAFICCEYRPLLDGVELADSFDFNPHKWLLTNFDCSTMWVQEKKWLLDSLSLTPEYLRSKEYDAGLVEDYRDWQIPLGRRFRSLKLFFTLRMFGKQALQEHIRNHCRLAARFAQWVSKDPNFEIVTQPSLSLVCFRLKATNEQNEKLLEAVNNSGQAFLIHTKLEGKMVLRFAVGSPQTRQAHIDAAWELISSEANKLL